MNQVSDVVKKIFEDFERASNTFEGDLLALQFSDPFMAADPDGRIQVAKKDDFIAGISKRQAFFQSIGFHLHGLLRPLPLQHLKNLLYSTKHMDSGLIELYTWNVVHRLVNHKARYLKATIRRVRRFQGGF